MTLENLKELMIDNFYAVKLKLLNKQQQDEDKIQLIHVKDVYAYNQLDSNSIENNACVAIKCDIAVVKFIKFFNNNYGIDNIDMQVKYVDNIEFRFSTYEVEQYFINNTHARVSKRIWDTCMEKLKQCCKNQ